MVGGKMHLLVSFLCILIHVQLEDRSHKLHTQLKLAYTNKHILGVEPGGGGGGGDALPTIWGYEHTSKAQKEAS
jgi:hypothetical protein